MKVVLPVEYCPRSMTVGGASKSLGKGKGGLTTGKGGLVNHWGKEKGC